MKQGAVASWTVGARSETGYVRKENEDRMSRVRFCDGYAYIVSDGMGGHNAGAKAAETTVRTLEEHLSTMRGGAAIDETLKEAFAAANANVFQLGHAGDAEIAGMGATAVVCVTTQSSALVAHIGDSRAYLHRRRRLTRLTRDHTRAQDMVDAGVLTADEADHHPDANILSKAIGHLESVKVDIGTWLQLRAGDEILLCSDGLCGEADDVEIEEVLRHDESPQNLADRLIALALDRGGSDNVTVQLIRFGHRPAAFDWRPLRYQAAALPVLVLSCAATIYLMGVRLEETLSKRMMVIETQTRALRQSSDDWKTMLEQQLEAVRQQLASLNERINERMTQNAGILEAEKVAQHSPATTKPRKGRTHPGTRHTAPASVGSAAREPVAAPSESNVIPANAPKLPDTDSATVEPWSPQ
jgi:serine/threonine protein phosphatase PrpC